MARTQGHRGLPEAERAEAEKDPASASRRSGPDPTSRRSCSTSPLASLNLGFGGDSPGGVYHSVYDSFEWYTKCSRRRLRLRAHAGAGDRHGACCACRRRRCCRSASRTCPTRSRATWPRCRSCTPDKKDAPAIDFAPLARGGRRAVEGRRSASRRRYAGVPGASARALQTQQEALKVVNQLVFSSERRLGNDAGLPRRDWFRHQIYAPGLLHRLRREDAAADSRGPGRRAVGRSASGRDQGD